MRIRLPGFDTGGISGAAPAVMGLVATLVLVAAVISAHQVLDQEREARRDYQRLAAEAMVQANMIGRQLPELGATPLGGGDQVDLGDVGTLRLLTIIRADDCRNCEEEIGRTLNDEAGGFDRFTVFLGSPESMERYVAAARRATRGLDVNDRFLTFTDAASAHFPLSRGILYVLVDADNTVRYTSHRPFATACDWDVEEKLVNIASMMSVSGAAAKPADAAAPPASEEVPQRVVRR